MPRRGVGGRPDPRGPTARVLKAARGRGRRRARRAESLVTTTHSHRFGAFGGRYVPETLIPALDELETAYDAARADPAFAAELEDLLTNYVGRPSPLSDAPRFSERVGARVWLK